MTAFQALLTGPAGGPAGTPVGAHFFGAQLVVDAPGPTVDVAQLVVSVGGVDGPELFLNWLDGQGRQASLKPLTADDIAIVLQEAPAALQPQLQRLWNERQRNRRQVSGWLALLAGRPARPSARISLAPSWSSMHPAPPSTWRSWSSAWAASTGRNCS